MTDKSQDSIDKLVGSLRAFSIAFDGLSIAMNEMADRAEAFGPRLGRMDVVDDDDDLASDSSQGGGMDNSIAYQCSECKGVSAFFYCPQGCEDAGTKEDNDGD